MTVPRETVCDRCGETIHFPDSAYHRVRGWERKREQGGANVIHLRERTGTVICNGCYESLRLEHERKVDRRPKRGPILNLGDAATRDAIRAVTDTFYPDDERKS